MTMKCIIPGSGVKLFGRAIHCLSKIGDEIFFEALQIGLALRTVNSSRSAYACFTFQKPFFYEYDEEFASTQGEDLTELLKCKLTMRSCLSIFKSLGTIDKTVEQCRIEFQPQKCRLVFILYCKHGITKTHNLAFQECESLQAVYSKELCPNLIVAQSRVLLDTMMNFPNSCEEITLSVCPESVKVTNYVDDEPDPTKIVRTEMSLVPDEFDNYQIGIDTHVTFCLKELRAILSFSEFVNQSVAVHFEHAGKPIVFSLDNDGVYTGNFVMATLSENNETTSQNTDQSGVRESNVHKTPPRKKELNKTQPEALKGSDNTTKRRKTDHEQVSPEQTVPGRIPNTGQQNGHFNGGDDQIMKDDFFTESFPSEDILGCSENRPPPSTYQRTKTLNSSILRSSALPGTVENIDLTSFIDDDEFLPSTPPCREKIKSVGFFGGGEKDDGSRPMKPQVLLAADTDEEDE